MAGLKLPVSVNKSGGLSVNTDEAEHTKQLLMTAFGESNDDNPFQDAGMDQGMIFSIDSPGFRARAEKAVMAVIAKFSDRIKLASSAPMTLTRNDDQEVILSFEYIDLQTDSVQEFRKTVTR